MNMISMNNLLPVIPQPPHDPMSWLLNALAGWRTGTLGNVEQAPTNGVLALAPIPGSGRSLTEKSGSFGGLTLPANVALGPDDNIYMLDNTAIELKLFDSCECLFKTVPCFGGMGRGRRQLLNPHGIGICAGNLYVCDTGNHRLSIFALRGFVLRATWMPPASAQLSNPWEPYAVAFDGRGRVFVTDNANGCIHRFSPSGSWQTCLPGFGKVTNIAIDCQDRLYVVVEGVEDSVQVVDTNGQRLDTISRPDELVSRFRHIPFQVDAQGNLYLSSFCPTSVQQNKQSSRAPLQGVFDLHGKPVTSVQAQSGPLYNTEGLYISQELDSKLYQCQWHRIMLRAQLARGTRVTVSTYTAEVLQSIDDIALLPDNAWETKQAVSPADSGEWDCLVRSGGGRYLWLRLQFRSSGLATPTIESVQIEFPRISLRRYLPAVFAEDPGGTQFTDRFLSIFDTTLRSVEKEIDTQARYFDPLDAPADPDPKTGVDFLTWLASWIGLVFDRQLPEAKRRQLLKGAARLYHIRGTREGLRQLLLFYLGMEPETNCCSNDQPRTLCHPQPTNCEPVEKLPYAWQPPPLILEHYQLRRWLFLGAGRLGDQAVLWGKRIVDRSQLDAGAQLSHTQLITTQDPFRDPFHVYAHKFSVFVPASFGRSDQQRKALENLLNAERPAHTLAQLVFVEPRFRIGFQSMIGLDSVIGRYPEGVTLSATPLGQGSVLGEPPYKQGGPTFQIGTQSRLGTTTKLD
jgi:phage tail-like protein